MKVLKLIAVSVAMLATNAFAQTVSGVKVEPAQIKAGESVKVTVSFDNADNPNCGMKIKLGDGREERVKINQAKDIPYVLTHTYAKAGNYTVYAEPSGTGSTLKCNGKTVNAAVAVAAVVAPVAAAPAAAAPVAPAASATKATPAAKSTTPCPAGWTLAKPGVNKKTQAFTCSAKAGTKIPEPKLSCPGDLTYFDNSKKGQLGCRV
ncbi:hypothetical protein [Variovorax sp. PCZ-1]|uniref:hypothetical protein n=1 Tax=Variovorax sp. PCZ-1 TaxID=2835533 RepID=UPI001BCADF60|nr:hypothetical protein [Variovorax sp. PCZ-1]MBS7808894.1 hypothetical protein [Variovorax sp. PCZ-1]